MVSIGKECNIFVIVSLTTVNLCVYWRVRYETETIRFELMFVGNANQKRPQKCGTRGRLNRYIDMILTAVQIVCTILSRFPTISM